MAPKYRVTYFPIKALGEPIRLLLSYGNIEFEDRRISSEDWPKFKESMPLGQMPTLEIDDKVYFQSVAICRFLGKKFGVAGSNDEEALEIDIAVDSFNDFRQKLAGAAYESDEAAKEAKYKILIAEVIPFFLKKLEERATANNGHMALGKLTWADFYFTGLIDYVSHISRQDILAKNPNLKAIKDNVLALPAIQAFYAKAPKTEY